MNEDLLAGRDGELEFGACIALGCEISACCLFHNVAYRGQLYNSREQGLIREMPLKTWKCVRKYAFCSNLFEPFRGRRYLNGVDTNGADT